MSESHREPAQTDIKIVDSLERLTHVLRQLLWDKAKEVHLSPIQIQFLLFLKDRALEHCRVSYLAEEFGLTQATVSDAIRVLTEKEFLNKEPHPDDRRIQTLILTRKGANLVRKLENWQAPLIRQVMELPEEDKSRVLLFLMKLIVSLQRSEVIASARICMACQHFRPFMHDDPAAPHHCTLTDTPLAIQDFKLDCPFHKPEPGGKEVLKKVP
ncbi:MAG TPA: MarR family winged helix-turn-helix transcriptional regulator [Thermoanaerobaculia bacterium]|nr:MarR family winged helix-turn-helix transcriptional regulator [Thermoanaerobaculia bacterium]HUM29938.1 MarR family winged helix-turn-helix transcriptional regulator [Thermoanaerobaculia bacterium]HXK68195.1 MarR family winged helix-turn-helix transcriptional regulator [Thermoanaerobaculia bacterium]